MIFLFGERVRSRSAALPARQCAVCRSQQAFSEQTESTWFTMFGLPLLPIEQTASYERCENCLSAYARGRPDLPSSVPVLKRVLVYLLLGYHQGGHLSLASEICLKLSGFELSDDECRALVAEINAGGTDMVEVVRSIAPLTNAVGKQQILEGAFLATYACCDLQYEDRLRINLMGNAMGVGLEFVDFAIEQARRQNYYGIRRLRVDEPLV